MTITDHHINECNKHITVVRHGQGETYVIGPPAGKLCRLHFQNGPVGANGTGINGITNEALIAVVVDRLRFFQSGAYACEENQDAIDALFVALKSMAKRGKRREAKGIEGTHQVDKEAEGPTLSNTLSGDMPPPVRAEALLGESPPKPMAPTKPALRAEKPWPGQLGVTKGKK